MFSAVLENVRDVYIDEQAVDDLAIAGLRRLDRIDPAATIERSAGDIRLLINGTTIGRVMIISDRPSKKQPSAR